VIDSPKGSRQAFVTMRPGWAEFFMGMAVLLFLVVVDQLNIKGVHSVRANWRIVFRFESSRGVAALSSTVNIS
jgi:hypothetical protein